MLVYHKMLLIKSDFLIFILFMIKTVIFVLGLAGNIDAEALERIYINLRKKDGRMDLAALEFSQFA